MSTPRTAARPSELTGSIIIWEFIRLLAPKPSQRFSRFVASDDPKLLNALVGFKIPVEDMRMSVDEFSETYLRFAVAGLRKAIKRQLRRAGRGKLRGYAAMECGSYVRDYITVACRDDQTFVSVALVMSLDAVTSEWHFRFDVRVK